MSTPGHQGSGSGPTCLHERSWGLSASMKGTAVPSLVSGQAPHPRPGSPAWRSQCRTQSSEGRCPQAGGGGGIWGEHRLPGKRDKDLERLGCFTPKSSRLPSLPRGWVHTGLPAHSASEHVATYSGDDSGVRLDISSGVGTVHTGRTGREGTVTLCPPLTRDPLGRGGVLAATPRSPGHHQSLGPQGCPKVL